MRIGIDLGGTKIEGILMGPHRVVRKRVRRATPLDQHYDAIIETVNDIVEELERASPSPCTVGIGTPGTASRVDGRMKNCNTTSLNGHPLLRDLESTLGRTIRLANDANCFAFSEALDGAAEGYRVVFGVIIGTGVGGGIVIDGRIHDGPNGIAGEWGHTSIDPAGPLCYCGDRGCIETFLSGPGLAASYVHAGGDPDATGPDIVARAERGEVTARAVMDEYVRRFGRSLAGVVDVLDPDCIVLGGGLSSIDRLYRDGPDAVARHVFSDDLRTPIVRNRHGDSSGVRGAAMLWPIDGEPNVDSQPRSEAG